MTGRKIIVFLFCVLLVVIGVSILRTHIRPMRQGRPNIVVPSPTPEPPTGTFVDRLYGRFVYYEDGHFFEVILPSRISTQIAGIDPGSGGANTKTQKATFMDAFPGVRPAWSTDGKLFALVANESSVAILTYATGAQVSHLTLNPKLDLSKRVEISFSADGLYLLVKQDNGQTLDRIFEVATGKQVITQAGCSYLGAWMRTGAHYATTCQIDGKSQILLLDPAMPDQSIFKVGAPDSYNFLNTYDSTSLLVVRNQTPGMLGLDGGFTFLNPKQYKGIPSISAFADLPRALADKIESVFKTEKIDDLVVASTNNYALYHTPRGIWAISLPLKESPYFLFPGSLPSIQPF